MLLVRLLSTLLGNPAIELISRSERRISEGITSVLRIGGDQPLANDVCASRLTKHLGTGASLEITPHFHFSDELTLHVVVSQHLKLGCLVQPVKAQNQNEFDIRLRKRDVAILGGLNPLPNSNANSQLVIALVPEVIDTSDVAR